MTARYGYQPTPRHNEPMDEREVERHLSEERMSHHLNYREGRSMALCSCGKSMPDATPRTAQARHHMHVEECVRVLRDRLEGRL